MKRYCHISLFRVGFLLMISLLLRNPLIYVLSFAYLLAFNIYDAIAYAMALFISSFLFLRNDLLPIGIVDYERNGYFVVNKFLYKVKAYGESLKTGDVILFDDRFNDFANFNCDIFSAHSCIPVRTIGLLLTTVTGIGPVGPIAVPVIVISPGIAATDTLESRWMLSTTFETIE